VLRGVTYATTVSTCNPFYTAVMYITAIDDHFVRIYLDVYEM